MAVRRLNVTLVVEEDLLRKARAVAAQRQTSVNEMVRQFLKDMVSQESRRLAALERIQPLLDRPSVQLGTPRPSRDELHER
jgi:plasmid stability protein